MVEVKFNLMKRDFVWMGLIVVLLGVGFGYATGGTDPAVMGHSGGELDLSSGNVGEVWADLYCDSTGENCFASAEFTGSSSGDLVYGLRGSAQCTAAGGTVELDADLNKFCKFSGASCAVGGWVPYKSWTVTTSGTCSTPSRACVYSSSCGATTTVSCSYGSHAWGDVAPETCTVVYSTCTSGSTCTDGGDCDWCSAVPKSKTCAAVKTEIGCY